MIILMVVNYAPSLRTFRGALIESLLERGHTVHVAAPGLSAHDPTRSWLAQIGVSHHDIPLSRAGLNPFAELRSVVALASLMQAVRADAVLAYTIKGVVWGLIAARLARVPRRFAVITGLGVAFIDAGPGGRSIVRGLAERLYRLSLGFAQHVFFLNPDDRDLFVARGILDPATPSTVLDGEGVDTHHFAEAPLPAGPLHAVMIARLLGDKGVREYVAAARIVRQSHPEARFHLVGGQDSNPDAIPEAEIARWQAEDAIHWHGSLDDVRPALAAANLYVLPSYREGMPRTILEAMAMGRPVVTTDVPGCRQTVSDGVTGLIVPPRDTAALADALRALADDPDRRAAMGCEARKVALARYDDRAVNAVIINGSGF